MKTKKSIVYLGNSDFPYGLAEVQKMILISKSLLDAGCSVTVVCNRSNHEHAKHPDLKSSGSYEGIDFIYVSGTPFRSDKFFIRNWMKAKGVFNEIRFLNRLKKENKFDYAILSVNGIISVLYYFFLSKLIGFKTILNHVEFYSAQRREFRLSRKVNNLLYDNYSFRLVDGVFQSANFQSNACRSCAPEKILKIPF